MSVIGKGSSSFRKKDVMEQKSIALGFKKIRWAHKATVGDTGINMNALVQPSEMAAYGFTNPTATAIAGANLFTYRSNLKLVSSLRGLLVDQLSYVVNSSTQISFIDFTAEDGEIFTGWIDDSPTTSLSVVDGNQIVASGILLAGQTDFNIGTPIEINKNPASQMGAIMVFADRGLQYRKVGNITSGDGDYIEVPVPGGLGSLIRFNASASDRYITVVSNGVVAERPDGSMMAVIERVQGQVDAMVPTLAAVAGVPETTFQTAPNNIDLKQFGETVGSQGDRITALENAFDTKKGMALTLVQSSVQTLPVTEVVLNPATIERNNASEVTWNAGTQTATIIKGGEFLAVFNVGIDMINAVTIGGVVACRVYHNGVNIGEDFQYFWATNGLDVKLKGSVPFVANPGDTVQFRMLNNSGNTQQTFGAKTQGSISLVKVGEL